MKGRAQRLATSANILPQSKMDTLSVQLLIVEFDKETGFDSDTLNNCIASYQQG